MLEERLKDMILSVEDQIGLVKLKLKNDKKDLKQLRKLINDNEYVDKERIQKDELRLNEEISELDIRIYKLNKILYRLKVCEKILNNEE